MINELEIFIGKENEKVDKESTIRKNQNEYIKKLIIEYQYKLKEILDPGDKLNNKGLSEEYFRFINANIGDNGIIYMLYFGVGSISRNDIKHMDINKLGWLEISGIYNNVELSKKGYDIAKEFYMLAGYREMKHRL